METVLDSLHQRTHCVAAGQQACVTECREKQTDKSSRRSASTEIGMSTCKLFTTTKHTICLNVIDFKEHLG